MVLLGLVDLLCVVLTLQLGVGKKCEVILNSFSTGYSLDQSYIYTGYKLFNHNGYENGTRSSGSASLLYTVNTSNGTSYNQAIRGISLEPLCTAHATLGDGAICNCDTGYAPDPTNKYCILGRQETYTISLSTETASIEPGKTCQLTAAVTKQGGGTPSQPIPVFVKVEVDPTSGGHVHGDSTRFKGSVSPAYGSTQILFTFTATDVSGAHIITAMCDLCVNKSATATVNVKVDGLEQIPDASFYTLVEADGTVIGSTAEHKSNHYLNSEAANILLYMAASYHIEDKFWQFQKARKGRGQYAYTPAPLLHLNDSSLVWGGKFDVHGHWTGDHAEHRRGTVIDIRANSNSGAIPPQNFENFIELAAFYGADARIHHAGELSQHFHVRLLGRGE